MDVGLTVGACAEGMLVSNGLLADLCGGCYSRCWIQCSGTGRASGQMAVAIYGIMQTDELEVR